jgi:hypothetical protein
VVEGMHIIMGMPPHIIIMGIPADIMRAIASQRSFIMSIEVSPSGIILQVMPSFVISQDIRHIMGIMFMPIMPGIMPMPIMPGIIMPGIMFMPIMPGIIMPGIPIMFIGIMLGIIMGIMGIMFWPMFIGIIGMFIGIIGMFIAAVMIVLPVWNASGTSLSVALDGARKEFLVRAFCSHGTEARPQRRRRVYGSRYASAILYV